MRTRLTPSTLFSAVLLWSLCALAAAPYTGTWMATAHEDRLSFNFRVHEQGQMGLTLPRSALQGLNTAEGADTKFQLVREAGTVSFEGRFSGGEGAGHYRFEPNAAYLGEMGKLGYTQISPEEQLQLALFDVGPARVKALAELGYTKLSHDELLQVALFQVTPEHIRALKAAGYDKLSLEQLVASRIHGVTPEHIHQLAELGFRHLSFDELLATRIHGVTPEYIREIREAGYPNVTIEQLVEMRVHAIDSGY
ncbi:MAG: 4-hydroxy-3-methylbut-2-enyl diphosphate reductase, partial [Archangium sp.]